jgi:NAD(P)-dependent dehydrogenase (short-subunit alcohol dehydrogenase family)
VNDSGAAETVAQIANGGGAAVAVHLGVPSSNEVDGVLDRVLTAHGRLDVVVNNAGVLDNMGPVGEITDEEWSRVLGVNLTGAFNVSRRVIEPLTATGGNLVNVASIAGLAGGRAGTAYTISKHGVIGLTRSIAWMYAETGVSCNAVCPGAVVTNVGQSISSGVSESGAHRLSGVLATMVRPGAPVEVAAVVAFLASPAASLVNGSIVVADAGWMADTQPAGLRQARRSPRACRAATN